VSRRESIGLRQLAIGVIIVFIIFVAIPFMLEKSVHRFLVWLAGTSSIATGLYFGAPRNRSKMRLRFTTLVVAATVALLIAKTPLAGFALIFCILAEIALDHFWPDPHESERE
jgi:hypothetical protein